MVSSRILRIQLPPLLVITIYTGACMPGERSLTGRRAAEHGLRLRPKIKHGGTVQEISMPGHTTASYYRVTAAVRINKLG